MRTIPKERFIASHNDSNIRYLLRVGKDYFTCLSGWLTNGKNLQPERSRRLVYCNLSWFDKSVLSPAEGLTMTYVSEADKQVILCLPVLPGNFRLIGEEKYFVWGKPFFVELRLPHA